MPQKRTKNQQMPKFHLPVVSLSPVFFFLTSSCVRFRHLNLKSCFAVLPAVGRKKIELIMVKHLKSWICSRNMIGYDSLVLELFYNNWLTGSTPIDQWCFWSEARNKVAKEREKDCQQSKLPLYFRILDISGSLLYTNTTEFLFRLFQYGVAHDQWWFFDVFWISGFCAIDMLSFGNEKWTSAFSNVRKPL